MTPENITGPIAHHAEAPIWWPEESALLWVDGEAGDLLRRDRHGIHRRHVDDEYLAFARPRATGGLVAVGARTLHLSDTAGGAMRAAATLLEDSALRMNDGCCDPRGRLLAGSIAYDGSEGAAALLRVDPDLAAHTVVGSVSTSNGLGFTADGTRAYYVDTATSRVDVFEVRDGVLAARRALVEIPEEQGVPDGLTVAADGSVWVALWGGGAVHGYDADGELIERIELPVAQVSACTFGDDDLRTLFITTSAQGMPADHGTDAGSVYAVRAGVRGLPVLPFAG